MSEIDYKYSKMHFQKAIKNVDEKYNKNILDEIDLKELQKIDFFIDNKVELLSEKYISALEEYKGKAQIKAMHEELLPPTDKLAIIYKEKFFYFDFGDNFIAYLTTIGNFFSEDKFKQIFEYCNPYESKKISNNLNLMKWVPLIHIFVFSLMNVWKPSSCFQNEIWCKYNDKQKKEINKFLNKEWSQKKRSYSNHIPSYVFAFSNLPSQFHYSFAFWDNLKTNFAIEILEKDDELRNEKCPSWKKFVILFKINRELNSFIKDNQKNKTKLNHIWFFVNKMFSFDGEKNNLNSFYKNLKIYRNNLSHQNVFHATNLNDYGRIMFNLDGHMKKINLYFGLNLYFLCLFIKYFLKDMKNIWVK